VTVSSQCAGADECVGADAVVRPERSERPLQRMIGATQILVPVQNPRRPASKERKTAAHGASRGYERNKKLHQPRRGVRKLSPTTCLPHQLEVKISRHQLQESNALQPRKGGTTRLVPAPAQGHTRTAQ
jgi:hypothetical protein